MLYIISQSEQIALVPLPSKYLYSAIEKHDCEMSAWHILRHASLS